MLSNFVISTSKIINYIMIINYKAKNVNSFIIAVDFLGFGW